MARFRLFNYCLYGLFVTAGMLTASAATNHHDSVASEWKSEIPRPIHPEKELVDFYEKTWEIAAGRVRKGPEGLPASPYMDENCYEDSIWIWDTCFMSLFSKYAPKSFPGVESLDNFYKPIHDGVKSPLFIHIPDNPPLFAWVEREHFTMTGDHARINDIFDQKKYLQKHFDWFNTVPSLARITSCSEPVRRTIVGEEGFTWTGGASGMDNTPRGRESGGFGKIMWIDAISQQALSALCIADIYAARGMKEEETIWRTKYNKIKNTINQLYWDEEDGFYYDVDIATKQPSRVKTIASLWPLLAKVASPEQARRVVEHIRNPKEFGGNYPTPTLSRDDQDHNAVTGDYWRGGIWLPTSYMTIKALEQYGYTDLADDFSDKLVRQMLETYKNIQPKTIWECYNPSSAQPSTENGRRARPEFCGWSALGPISLFIENILGFRKANAITKSLHWRLDPSIGKHGITNYKFGVVTTDVVFDGDNTVNVDSNTPYRLLINGKEFNVMKGKTIIPLTDIPSSKK